MASKSHIPDAVYAKVWGMHPRLKTALRCIGTRSPSLVPQLVPGLKLRGVSLSDVVVGSLVEFVCQDKCMSLNFIFKEEASLLLNSLSYSRMTRIPLYDVVNVFLSLSLSPRSLRSFGGSRGLQRRWVKRKHRYKTLYTKLLKTDIER